MLSLIRMPTIEIPPGEEVTLTVDGKPTVTVTRPVGSEAAPTIETPGPTPPTTPPTPPTQKTPASPTPPAKLEQPLQEIPL